MPAPTRTRDGSKKPSRKTRAGATARAKHDIADPKSEILNLQQAAGNQATSRLLRNRNDSVAKHGRTAPSIVNQVVGESGQPLAADVRKRMESRFNHDFGDVRIHTGARADESARAVSASAYTVGRDVVFAADQYTPMTETGQRMLAHELAHVVQNSQLTSSSSGSLTISDPAGEAETTAKAAGDQIHAGELSRLPAAQPGQLFRQFVTPQIPQELQQSMDLTKLSIQELHERHDLIISVLDKFDESTPETQPLEMEAGLIGQELARREALSAGRTFSAADVDRMKKYFERNARKPKPRNCIDTMNDGLQELYGDKKLRVGDSVDRTMGALQKSGRAGAPVAIEMEDKQGRINRSGSRRPEKVHESVWDAILRMNGGDVGWSVFGMGPADMFHSVTLTLDNTFPAQPVIYWSDQWQEKAGWKKFDKAGLDAEVARVTQIIWEKKDEQHKPNPRVTLWRLQRNVSSPIQGKP